MVKKVPTSTGAILNARCPMSLPWHGTLHYMQGQGCAGDPARRRPLFRGMCSCDVCRAWVDAKIPGYTRLTPRVR